VRDVPNSHKDEDCRIHARSKGRDSLLAEDSPDDLGTDVADVIPLIIPQDEPRFELSEVVIELRRVVKPYPLSEFGERKRTLSRREQFAEDPKADFIPDSFERRRLVGLVPLVS
jgi:hypothetical protein